MDKTTNALIKLFHKETTLYKFAQEFSLLCIDLKDGIRNITMDSMIELYDDIVDSTPVDMGIAQANWQIEEVENSRFLFSKEYDSKGDRSYTEKAYGGRIIPRPKTPSRKKFYGKDHIVIFNNSPYIDELEGGSSPQSPSGNMIAKNVAKHKILYENRLRNTRLFK